MNKNKNSKKILSWAAKNGLIRVRDVIHQGIHPEYLRRLHDKGLLKKIGRGLYMLADKEISPQMGFAQVSKSIPNGVICLLSALQYHDIGTQNPFEIWTAIENKAAKPRIQYPPVRIVRFSGKALTEGIDEFEIEGATVKIFNEAKTIADCFKFRNKIGLEIALEALKDCQRRKLCSIDELWKYAKTCRVSNVMKPYLEALL